MFLHGNLGVSFISLPTPAATPIIQAMPWTIGLFGLAALLAWLLGVAAGIVGGFRDRRVWQWVATTALGSRVPCGQFPWTGRGNAMLA